MKSRDEMKTWLAIKQRLAEYSETAEYARDYQRDVKWLVNMVEELLVAVNSPARAEQPSKKF